jgi:sulfatase maturation enzyme AslB (radical SAM superfamily)
MNIQYHPKNFSECKSNQRTSSNKLTSTRSDKGVTDIFASQEKTVSNIVDEWKGGAGLFKESAVRSYEDDKINTNKIVNDYTDVWHNQEEPKRPQVSNLHVIYFTNKCNLKCTYCYEQLENKPAQIPTKDFLINQAEEIIKSEPDENFQSFFSLFGGEPLTQWDNVKTFMEKVLSMKNNVTFNLITNGILLTKPKFFKSFLEYFETRPITKQKFSIDISFDGIGNQERIYQSGKKSTMDVVEALSLMSKTDFTWRVRYTIHKANLHKFAEDMVGIINTFGPMRIISSIDSSMDDNTDLEEKKHIHKALEANIQNLRDLWRKESIHSPVCHLFCDMCNGCSGSHKMKRYWSTEGLVREQKGSENIVPFTDFDDHTKLDTTGSMNRQPIKTE